MTGQTEMTLDHFSGNDVFCFFLLFFTQAWLITRVNPIRVSFILKSVQNSQVFP